MKGDWDALKASMREIYNACTSGGEEPTTMILPCESCGKDVLFMRCEDGTTEISHSGCERAVVTMMTMNPRKLGVITSIT